MPFAFDHNVTDALPPGERMIEDRRENPVRGRDTKFRLLQQNIIGYTFSSMVPGFTESGINLLPFPKLIGRPLDNALAEGEYLYHDQFETTSNQVAKVAGDIFQQVESAILWNAAARWNRFMAGEPWPSSPRYTRPAVTPSLNRQVAILDLKRRYDWVRLLTPSAEARIAQLRARLAAHSLLLPTSTPDIIVVALPEACRLSPEFSTDLPNLSRQSQAIITNAYSILEGHVEPGEILLAIALKKSLRSDRLYQPLYESNVMQILLEGELGAPRVEFEVHTLESAGTAAQETYRAASLGLVATNHAQPHRAIRELYEPANADDLVRRFYDFLNERTAQIAA
jgi:hypothetical protein